MTLRQLAASLLTAALTISTVPASRAAELDPAAQKKQQQKAIADVEETARRITTALAELHQRVRELESTTERTNTDPTEIPGLSRVPHHVSLDA